MLVYELIIGHLLSNHRHHIAIDTALLRANGASSQDSINPDQSRRASYTSVGGSAKIPTKDHLRQSSEDTIEAPKRTESSPQLTAASVPPSTPGKSKMSNRRRNATPLDVMSPDPKPTSSPALVLGGSPPAVVRSGQILDPGGGNVKIRHEATGFRRAMAPGGRAIKSDLKSMVALLRQRASNALREGRDSALGQVLQQMLLQTKECLVSKHFELRRMAGQVLRPLSELVFHFDPDIMCNHWTHVAAWLAAKDTLSCRFAAETMLCCIKHLLGFEVAARVKDDSNDAPPSPQVATKRLSVSLHVRRRTTSGGSVSGLRTLASANADRFAEQYKCLRESLPAVLPALCNLAKKTVSKDLTAAVFELMMQIHSLFQVQEKKSCSTENDSDSTLGETSRGGAEGALASLRLDCNIEDACAHLDIVIGRVIGIHKMACDTSAVKQTRMGFVDAAGNKMSSKALATVLRKQKRAASINSALALALAPHLPVVLGNAITSVGQQLSLLPVVLAWALHGDKVDQRVVMLDAVIAVLQHPDIQGALLSLDNMALLESGITPLCSVLEQSPEAPVLGKVLDAVLALASVLPKSEVPKILGKILPVVASRLKQAAPQVRKTYLCFLSPPRPSSYLPLTHLSYCTPTPLPP
jgi:hypothetical protein